MSSFTVKLSVGLVVLVALLAGSALLFSPKPQKPEAKRERDLEARVVALTERVAQLERALERVTTRRPSRDVILASAPPRGPEHDAKAKPRAEGDPAVDSPTFEVAVRSVLEQVDWERDVERGADRARRTFDRAASYSERLGARLQLSPPQKELVTQLLVDQFDTFAALRGEGDVTGERPATRDEWSRRASEIREEIDTQLAQLLSPDQLEAYHELLVEEGFEPLDGAPRDRPISLERGRSQGPTPQGPTSERVNEDETVAAPKR